MKKLETLIQKSVIVAAELSVLCSTVPVVLGRSTVFMIRREDSWFAGVLDTGGEDAEP